MKILHIADLHLGKKMSEYSLLDDQKDFLNKTIDFMLKQDIKHLIVAGDIYDVSSPSGEAINLFNDFLNDLKKNNIKAFIISGNHDSNERVGYGNKLIAANGIYINTNIKDAITPITEDGINYYLFPYANVNEINHVFSQNFKSYDEAFLYLVSLCNLDKSKTNICVSHQVVLSGGDTIPELGGSEEVMIGTIQNISANVYKDFSYTALGHIHKPQRISENIRYSGSPISYHVDEAKYDKSYTIIEVENGKVNVSTSKIIPNREVVVLRDTFDNLNTKYESEKEKYVFFEITSDPVDNAMGKLKTQFKWALGIKYVNKNSVSTVDLTQKLADIKQRPYTEVFEELFTNVLGKELNERQKSIVNKYLKEDLTDEIN